MVTHRFVTITTHTNRHHILGVFHTLHSTFPKLVQCFLVRVVVPSTILSAMARPLLMRTCQRLMVTRSHANAHIVSCLHVQWVIGIEHGIPHGRPHIVTLQSEHQFKHSCIEFMVIAAIILLHPSCQARSLIVQEDATILHGRLTIRIDTLLDIKLVVLLRRHIRPVIPRAHTNLLAQFIDTVNRTTLVTTCNDQLILHRRDDEHLCLTFQILDGRYFLCHLINSSTLTQCTNYDGVILSPCHLLQILLQVSDGDMHTLPIVLIILNRSFLVSQTKGATLRGEHHKLLCCQRRDDSTNVDCNTQK